MSRLVWVEQDDVGMCRAIRIFRSRKAAFASGRSVVELEKSLAVSDIRHAVFLRGKGNCEWCPAYVTESEGHMHEKKHRGRGGEVSVENSVFICARCHRIEHKDRNPRWSQK